MPHLIETECEADADRQARSAGRGAGCLSGEVESMVMAPREEGMTTMIETMSTLPAGSGAGRGKDEGCSK